MVEEWVGRSLSIESGDEVTEKEVKPGQTPQIWTKGIENANKYFTLSIPDYSKVLTVLSDGKLMLKGMSFFCTQLNLMQPFFTE